MTTTSIANKITKLIKSPVSLYVFFGACTTGVNVGVYYVLRSFVYLPITVSNVISIACAIVFAYFTNSRFVFSSEAVGFIERFKEFVKFVSARISTMIIEIGGVLLLAFCGMDDRIGKLVIQFVVLVLNYVFSKFLVFTKKRNRSNEKS